MADARDWKFLRNVLLSLDKHVPEGEVVRGPPWSIPNDLTGPDARKYLEDVLRRFHVVEKAVEKAWTSPIVGVRDAARYVASQLKEGAQRASKIAEDVASDMKDSFDKVVDHVGGYLEETAKTVATITLGTVIGLIALIFAFKGRD